MFCPGPPRHYVARLGVTGWSEAWGWSETEAVSNLARALANDPPGHVPISLLGDIPGLIAWLHSGYDVPTLGSRAAGTWLLTDGDAL